MASQVSFISLIACDCSDLALLWHHLIDVLHLRSTINDATTTAIKDATASIDQNDNNDPQRRSGSLALKTTTIMATTWPPLPVNGHSTAITSTTTRRIATTPPPTACVNSQHHHYHSMDRHHQRASTATTTITHHRWPSPPA